MSADHLTSNHQLTGAIAWLRGWQTHETPTLGAMATAVLDEIERWQELDRRNTAEIERLTRERDKAVDNFARLEGMLYATEAERDRLRAALMSIARNTCCDKCQEAALVAREALRAADETKAGQ